MHQIIHIHADAPLKPALAAACNGCGVCCLAEPCPLGMLASLRREGACRLLRWDAAAARYRCGAFASASSARAPLRNDFVARLIGAGRGCDSDAVVDPR